MQHVLRSVLVPNEHDAEWFHSPIYFIKDCFIHYLAYLDYLPSQQVVAPQLQKLFPLAVRVMSIDSPKVLCDFYLLCQKLNCKFYNFKEGVYIFFGQTS